MARKKKTSLPVLRDYLFPEYGIKVRARSTKEAEQKLSVELKKQKRKKLK